MIKHKKSVLAMVLLSMPGYAYSEEVIEEIVVTAQKREQRLQDTPISISVETGEALDQSSFSGVTEVLSQVPGVVVAQTSQGGNTRITVRGISAAAAANTGSSPVGYYLDGAPWGFVRSALFPDPSVYDLDRIEVLRGPQGTLYGAGGANGLVRVITRAPDLDKFEFKGRGTLSSTEDGGANYRADAAINIPLIEGKLAIRGVVGYTDSDGWIDSPLGSDINDEERKSYRLKIKAQPTDNVSIGLSGWFARDNFRAPSTSSDDRTIISTLEQPIDTEFDLYNLAVSADFDVFSFESTTSYLDYENFSFLNVDSLFGFPLPFVFDQGFNSRVFSQEFVLNSTTDSAWRWTAGVFYRDAEDESINSGTFNVSVSESYAVFGEVGRKFGEDRFEWSAGLRYFKDDIDVDEFSKVTPRFVLQWYPSDAISAYASYSQGFRSGFAQSRFVEQAGFGDVFPNIEPDTLNNYEIGVKGDFADGRLSIDAAVYYIDWEDVQLNVQVPINFASTPAPLNGESASGVGVDLGVTLRPVDGFQFGGVLSWNDLTLDSDLAFDFGQGAGEEVFFAAGERLSFSAEYTAALFADYTFPVGLEGLTGTFSTTANYTSEYTNRFFPLPVLIDESDSFLNWRASFRLDSNDSWAVTLFADNITDDYGRGTSLGLGGPPSVASGRVAPDFATRTRPRTIGVQVDFNL